MLTCWYCGVRFMVGCVHHCGSAATPRNAPWLSDPLRWYFPVSGDTVPLKGISPYAQ